MANGLDPIVVDIKMRLDAKDMETSMQNYTRKFADNTKYNLNKTIQDAESTLSKGIKSLQSDLGELTKNSTADIFTRAADAVKVFSNRLESISSADSIDSVTAKVYNLERSLSDSASEILKLQSEFEQINRVTNAKNQLIEQFGSIPQAIEYVRQLREEADSLTTALGAKGAQSGPGNLEPMQALMSQIDSLRAKLQELRAERAAMDSRADKGTEKWTADMTALNSEIAKTTGKMGTLSKEFYAMGRAANFGKSKQAITETYNQAVRNAELWKEVRELNAVLSDVRKQGLDVNTVFGQLASKVEKFDSIVRALQAMADAEQKARDEAEKVNEEVGKIGDNAKKTGFSFNQWRNVVWSFSRLLGNVYTISLDIVRGARTIANFFMRVWNTAKKVLGVLKQWRKHITGTANEHAKSFKQMLKDIVRYSLGIRSLFALFRRLRTYIKEAFSAMAAQIPEVNAMLASLKSSLYALKGSLATAFEPILSAIAPALVRLIDLLAQAITYIGMFFAALTGRNFVYKANKVAQTIGKAAGAAKELNKQLQGFDELNNLTSSKGSGGSGGDTPLAQFEKVDVPDWIKNLAQQLKDLWDRIIKPIKDAWAKVGDYVVEAWKRAFNSVKDLLHDIGRDFLTVWDKMGEHISEMFFLIIGDVGNIIANIADKIREAWNFVEDGQTESNGIRFWTAILSIVDAILTGVHKITDDIKNWTAEINITPAMTAFVHWLESLVPIVEMVMEILYQFWDRALKPILTWAFDGENSGIARFFQILADFNDSLDKEKIIEDLNKIWDAIGRFGINIGEGLLIFMERMLGYLSDWLNSDDFTEWCQKVADFLDGLKPEDLADDLEQVWRIIKNIAEWTWKAIKYVIDHKDQILDFLEWCSEHLDIIAGLVVGGKLFIDLARFVANIALFFGAISKMFGGQGLFSIISGAISGLSGKILPIIIPRLVYLMQQIEVFLASSVGALLTNLVAGIVSFFVGAEIGKKIGAWIFPEDKDLYEHYSGIKGTLELVRDTAVTLAERTAEHVSDAWDNIKEAAKTLGERTKEHLGEAAEWIKEKWNSLKEWFNSVWGTISDWFKTYVTEPIKMAFSDAWTAITNVWNGIKEFFQPLGEFLVSLWEGVTSRVSKFFEGCWIIIKAVWIIVSEWFNENVIQPLQLAWQDFTDTLQKLWDTVVEFVKKIWNDCVSWIKTNIIQPLQMAWDDLSKKIQEAWNTAVAFVKKIWNDLVTNIKQLWTTFYSWLKSTIIEPIKKAWDTLCTTVATYWNSLVTKVKSIWTSCKSWFDTTIIQPLKSAFNTMCEAISGFFNDMWTKIKDGAKSAINWVITKIESGINGMIDGVNKFFDLFNGAVEWAADITGESWSGIELIKHVSLPKLAQGAVIPPNKEFLAVLGDQKHGTNIEAPLDTMVQAFNMANRGGNEAELRLLQEQNDLLRQLLQKEFGISERQIYNSVINQDNIRRKSTGYSAFAY